jgi:hypothetical protein
MSEITLKHVRQQWDGHFADYHLAAQAHNAASEAADHARYDRVCNLRHHAWAALILAPAPDLAALTWKINELFGEEAMAGIGDDADSGWPRQFTDAIAADAKRLRGAATGFDAQLWISDWVAVDGGWACTDGRATLCASIPATPRQNALLVKLRDAGGSDAVHDGLIALDRRVH